MRPMLDDQYPSPTSLGRSRDHAVRSGGPSNRAFDSRAMAWVGALLLLVLVAYIPAYSAEIGIHDDEDYIIHNQHMCSLGGLWTMWTDPHAMAQYYPVTFSTYWLEYQLWDLHPLGYHLVNVLLHALAAVLLWRLLVRLTVPGAWLAAALYAVHPVCVESVAWVAEQKNTLSMVFALGSLLCYLRFAPADANEAVALPRPARRGQYFLALSLFAAGLLSKTAVVTLPAVLLVIYWWKRGRIAWSDVLPLVPFIALGISLGALTSWIEVHHLGAQGDDWSRSPVEKVLIAGRALWFYSGKLIWPYPLIHFYPKWEIDATAWRQYLYPAAALCVLAALWFSRRWIGRGPLAAVLIFAGVLAPGLGFFNIWFMQHSLVADHFQYHAAAALIALAAAGCALITASLAPPTRRATLVLGGVAVATLLGLSFAHARNYHSAATLQRDVLAKNPDSWISYMVLGVELSKAGSFRAAIRLLQEAVDCAPDQPMCHYNLAWMLVRAGEAEGFQPGQLDLAIGQFRESQRLKPDMKADRVVFMLKIIGESLLSEHRPDEAIRMFNDLLETNRDDDAVTYHMAVAEEEIGNLVEAAQWYEKTLRMQPADRLARLRLGGLLVKLGRVPEALPHLQAIAHAEPNSPEPLIAVGQAQLALGQQRQAAESFRDALRIRSDDTAATLGLAAALLKLDLPEEASEHLNRVLLRDPGSSEAQALMERALQMKLNRPRN